MAVSIRLTRLGKHKAPLYRIVAVDSRNSRDGKYLELIGTYDSIKGKNSVNKEVALKWLSQGAIPTDTVKKIFSQNGVNLAHHESKVGKKPAAKKATKSK